MHIRLTPLGVQVGKLLHERPAVMSAENAGEVVGALTVLYKSSGRDMCDLFDELYEVKDDRLVQIKAAPDTEWPEVVGQ